MILILEPPSLDLISIALEPQSALQRDQLRRAFADEQASVHEDPESGQWILTDFSEAKLDSRVAALVAVVGPIGVGAPQVAYRETITRAATAEAVHVRISGPTGQFAKVRLSAEPAEWSRGVLFENLAPAYAIPEVYLSGVQQGLEDAARRGLLANFALTGLTIRLLDGAYHDVDSSPEAFRLATLAAVLKLRQTAEPAILEPIMQIEATVPVSFAAAVAADLRARRGNILKEETAVGDRRRILAQAPLSNLIGHDLTSLTGDRGEVRLVLTDYAALPSHDPDTEPFPPAAAMRA